MYNLKWPRGERGVSVILGAALVIAMLITATSAFLVVWIPGEIGRMEYQHMKSVEESLLELKSQIEDLGTKPRDVGIKMGSESVPFFPSPVNGGELLFNPGSDWYSFDWDFKYPVTINNENNPNELTDYPVKVVVNWEPGMREDFSDLRFMDEDGMTLLPYWVEPPVVTETVGISADADSYIDELRPDSNGGNETYLAIVSSRGYTTGLNTRSVIKFSTSSIPMGATIHSAVLYLYCYTAMAAHDYRIVNVHRQLDVTWGEMEVTWNNQPAFHSVPTASTPIRAGVSEWKSWVVTGDIQPQTLVGWTLRDNVENDGLFALNNSGYVSEEGIPYEGGPYFYGLYPYLEINYTGVKWGTTATIWVKVPYIPARGSKTIWMYYGNPNAPNMSNGDAVFDFCDDFSNGIIDASKWNLVRTSDIYTETENDYLHIGSESSPCGLIASKQAFGGDITLEYAYEYSEITSLSMRDGLKRNPTITCENALFSARTTNYDNFEKVEGGIKTILTGGLGRAAKNSYKNRIDRIASQSKVNYWLDNVKIVNGAAIGPSLTGDMHVFIGDPAMTSGDYTDVKIYWVRVRKYTEPEPTIKVERGTATWWNFNWNNRRPITINNSGNPNMLENYQVKVFVPCYEYMRPDFDDLRFVENEGAGELSYWIENYNYGENAMVWVKVPKIPASGSKTIWMYYGNPPAVSASDGDATFDFFDDFLETNLDSNKWLLRGRSMIVENGYVKIGLTPSGGWSYDGIVSKTYKLVGNGIVEYRSKTAMENGYGEVMLFRSKNNHGSFPSEDLNTQRFWSYTSSPGHAINIGGSQKKTVNNALTYNTWKNFRVVFKGSNLSFKKFTDGWGSEEATVSYNDSGGIENGYIGLRGTTAYGKTGKHWCDWVRVRKYTELEPTASIGEEEKKIASPMYGDIRFDIKNYYYPDQTWAYESGAVILIQDNVSVMESPPGMVVVREIGDNKIEIYFNTIRIRGLDDSISGTGTSTIRASILSWHYPIEKDLRENVTIRIRSSYTRAWKQYLQDLYEMLDAGGYNPDGSFLDTLQLTILGKDTSPGVKDIYYFERIMEVEIRIS